MTMKRKINVTEAQFRELMKQGLYEERKCVNEKRKILVTEEQYKKLISETRAIRSWTDDDYKKVNPNQINNFDFKASKELDDEYNEKYGAKALTAKDLYDSAKGIQQTEINRVQSQLTDKLKDKLIKRDGTDIVSPENLGTLKGNGTILNILKDVGLKLEIAGKTLSYGNHKLPENTLIINMTSAWNCPSIEKGECPLGNVCYARRGEGQYQQLQIRNLRNQFTFKELGVKDILKLVETYIEQAPVRIKYIRMSEDGDFPDQETVNFCDKLAGHLYKKYGIKTTAYTHRQLDYSGLQYMQIDASDYRIKTGDRYFIAIPKQYYDMIPEGLHLEPYETSIPKQVVNTQNGTWKCICDCRKCSFCYQTKEENGEPNDKMITVVECIRK